MSKSFFKNALYSFLGAIPLNLVLILAFKISEKSGLVHLEGSNLFIILGIYATVLLIYIISVAFYFNRQSSENLEKLKLDVESITGKKLPPISPNSGSL